MFYNESSYSSIKSVLNQDPSTIKTFNTISYEGSQAYAIKPLTEQDITVDNSSAWVTNKDIQGWKCVDIKSSLDTGSVIEFVKKEGKWFNYIKGENTIGALDTSRFSVQGIGVVESVQNSNFVPQQGVIGGYGGGNGGGNGDGNNGGNGGGYTP